MEDNDHIGARLDRLPLSRFHFRIFGIISFGLLLTGFLSYSGNVVLWGGNQFWTVTEWPGSSRKP